MAILKNVASVQKLGGILLAMFICLFATSGHAQEVDKITTYLSEELIRGINIYRNKDYTDLITIDNLLGLGVCTSGDQLQLQYLEPA